MGEGTPEINDGQKKKITEWLRTKVVLEEVKILLLIYTKEVSHELATKIAGDFHDLEDVATIIGGDVEAAKLNVDKHILSEDDQFIGKIASAILELVVKENPDRAEMNWLQFVTAIQRSTSISTLIGNNPKFTDKALELLSKGFADTIISQKKEIPISQEIDPEVDFLSRICRLYLDRTLRKGESS